MGFPGSFQVRLTAQPPLHTMAKMKPHLRILGTRGIPAEHGGFETFAEHCALYLQKKGWDVTVYCQTKGTGPVTEDHWQSIRRITIPVDREGPLSTMIFDWQAITHASRENGVVLCLGYNTALFNLRLTRKNVPVVINMDGIEWRRDKWHLAAKIWFYLNEKAGVLYSTHLIADNPGIADHLYSRGARRPLTTIPYGALHITDAPVKTLESYELKPSHYILLIARPEPENSILEIVRAFSSKIRPCRLVILGNYSTEHSYQNKILEAASDQVNFLGAIYDPAIVSALRYHCLFYVHGHTVGGTNPSLVEALGAGNPVLAHDNKFNRWVTGDEAAEFFSTEKECAEKLDTLINSPDRLEKMRAASTERFLDSFTWDTVLDEYEQCLRRYRHEDHHT